MLCRRLPQLRGLDATRARIGMTMPFLACVYCTVTSEGGVLQTDIHTVGKSDLPSDHTYERTQPNGPRRFTAR
eukprot:3016377-Prymnesium_polylepis.1